MTGFLCISGVSNFLKEAILGMIEIRAEVTELIGSKSPIIRLLK